MLRCFLPVLSCNSFFPSCVIEISSTDTLHPSLTLSCTSLEFLLGFCHGINLFCLTDAGLCLSLCLHHILHSENLTHDFRGSFTHSFVFASLVFIIALPQETKELYSLLSPLQQVLEMLDCLNSGLVSKGGFHVGSSLSSYAVVYTLILYRKRDSRKKWLIYFHTLHQRNNNHFFYAMELHVVNNNLFMLAVIYRNNIIYCLQ